MQTWKISIKPASEKGFKPFEKCRELELVGIGWAWAYEKHQPKDREEAAALIKAAYEEDGTAGVNELGRLFDEIQSGDHLWTHKHGHYHLCVAGEKTYYGRDICPDFLGYDLGHARSATWIEVPDELVLGSIQRGVIARRMIQKIRLSEPETNLNQYIEKQLIDNPHWLPTIGLNNSKNAIQTVNEQTLLGIMSPDDVEDVIASKLQTEGWILLKSTCFRSKPKFEFQMINAVSGKAGMIQVKSGRNVQLEPRKYKDHLTGANEIFLFTTCQNDPYPGGQVADIHCISKQEVIDWMKTGYALLSPTMKLKLSLLHDFQ